MEDGLLTIQGERHFAHDSSEQQFHRVERRYGAFRRSITLPAHVLAEQIQASFENGVLQILVPKAEEAKPKRIQVRPGPTEDPAATQAARTPRPAEPRGASPPATPLGYRSLPPALNTEDNERPPLVREVL